jgi:threonine aldolase
MAEAGVEVSAGGPGRIRCVTHLDVDRVSVERAVAAFRQVLA